MPQLVRTQIGQFVFVEVAPDMFDLIQLGRIAGQLLQRERLALGGDEIAHRGAAMARSPSQITSSGRRKCRIRCLRNSIICGALIAPGNSLK